MGTDIHFYVEKKNTKGDWITAESFVKQYDDEDIKDVPYKESFYNGRNYNLFSILADVRNGIGFAGIRTGDGYNPIAPPRGLPDDACKEVREISEYSEGHSHSYFTVQELINYDWTQTTKNCGFVPANEFINWVRCRDNDDPTPRSYSGDVSGGNILKITEAEAMVIFNKAKDDISKLDTPLYGENWEKYISDRFSSLYKGQIIYVSACWEISYYQAASHFLSHTIPKLLKLSCDNGGLGNVRIVFWFDN